MMISASPPEAARTYIERGYAPIVVAAGQKRPTGNNWQKQYPFTGDVARVFAANTNIGILLGAPSGGIVDVDIDSQLAKRLTHLLPMTEMVHGRDGNAGSHYWYQVDGTVPPTTQFKNPVTGEMLIELRSTGAQTVVPPSCYTANNDAEAPLSQLTWEKFGKPANVTAERLLKSVATVAAVTAIAAVWNRDGTRHTAALALSGMLLQGGVGADEARALMEAICVASGDDEIADRLAALDSTAERVASGDTSIGATTLAEIVDPKIVAAVQKWLGLKPASSNPPYEWDLPIPMDEVRTPEIPASLLPGIYGEFAHDLADAAELPEAMTVMATLGVLSAVCAKHFVVSPNPDWNEPVNLFILQALPPANLKSMVLKSAIAPIDIWEVNQKLAMETEIRQAQSTRRNQESQIQSLRAKAAKCSNKIDQTRMFNEVTELEMQLVAIPVPPQIYVNDVTPETLATVVVEQNGRLAIISDEGGIFEVMAGLYNKGHANYDILLKGIDGGRVRLRRQTREVDVCPYLTMSMIVQPQILQNMGEKKAFQGRGLLERFLYVLPQSRLGHRSLDATPMSETVRRKYKDAITLLLELQPQIDHHGVETPRTLTLDDAARLHWQDFRHEVEVGLRPDGKLSGCLGWGGKIAGFTLRIAALMHIAAHGPSKAKISIDTMDRAVQMARLLVDHALAAFNLMRNDQAIDDGRAIFDWLQQLGQPRFRRTDCQRKFHGRFTGKKRFDAALSVLIDRNIISPVRYETTTEGKRPTGFYEVNPALLMK